MSKPNKIARGHAIVLVIGGEYRGSVLDASVVWNTDDSENRTREMLVEVSTVDSKGSHWRKGWNWAKKDIKWISRQSLENESQFDDGVAYNVNAKTAKAIKEHDGAWVIRLRK